MTAKRSSSNTSFLVVNDFTINSARESLQNIRRISEDNDDELLFSDNSEKTWSYFFLQKQFEFHKLESLFSRYTERVNRAYFSLFLILLFFLSTIHFLLVFVCNLNSASLKSVIVDLVCYSILILTSVIILLVNETFFNKRKGRLLVKMFCFVFSLLFIINFFVPLFHYLTNTVNILKPAYTTVLIISCYLFLNVKKGWKSGLIGTFISLCEIAYSVFFIYGICYESDIHIWRKISSDVVYLLCINLLGFYYRIINEIVGRRTFLDRRACVMSTLKLKHEEEQEEQLMLSIIPKYIIEEVKVDIMRTIESIEKSSKLPRQRPFENPYIHTYDNVSILYADVVNFTALTSTLKPVTKLVETLNDLFGSFDDASEVHNVLRIKFLGDCYYSVSGLPPTPAPNHAEACVDLGLDMIKIIRNVRESRDVKIDMRIGVHSGQILSGLIGLTKWQFDVWSNDVLIANKMESSGEAGKVHITKQTKDLLNKPYNIIPTDKGKVLPDLKPFNVETYLISPFEVHVKRDSGRKLSMILDEQSGEQPTDFRELMEKNNNQINKSPSYVALNNIRSFSRTPSILSTNTDSGSEDPYSSIYFRRESVRKTDVPVLRRASSSQQNQRNNPIIVSERRSTAGENKRRTAFMNSYIKKYREYLQNTDDSVRNAVDKMPLTKYEQWFKVKQIHPFFLTFKNLKTEFQFMRQDDPLFKFAILMQILIVFCFTLIQNLTLSVWQWSLEMNYAVLALLGFVITPILWAQYIWQKYVAKSEQETEPKSKIGRVIVRISATIVRSWALRSVIYVITASLCVACVLLELIHCDQYIRSREGVNEIRESEHLHDILLSGISGECVTPWNMTRAICLVIVIIFLFIKIYIWLKLILAIVFMGFYFYKIWTDSYEFVLASESTNYMVSPNLSHMLVTVFLALTLHLVDRQSDYLNRLDYNWNTQLNEEKAKTNMKHKVNSMLLKNILPSHVAEQYLDVNIRGDELFHEEFENVAVMFATVVDFKFDDVPERVVLEIMNRIIGEFDKILLTQNNRLIEKIKVINWTYMAACGLDPDRKDSSCDDGEINSYKNNEDVVITLLRFVLEMRKVLHAVGLDCFQTQIKLRVGISNGEVTAGVVGAKKPLYDIWGDSVNMASRMETRGIPGKIQVSENTAKVIMAEGYECQFRDYIFVKGKGNHVPTYFVSLDENDNLVPNINSFDTRL